jgi:hypothetical protein
MGKKIKISESQYERLTEGLNIGGIEIFSQNGKLKTNKGINYEMCAPKGFMCIDLTVEDIYEEGGDYIIKLDTPLGKKNSIIPKDTLQKILSNMGEDEIEIQTKEGDIRLVKL